MGQLHGIGLGTGIKPGCAAAPLTLEIIMPYEKTLVIIKPGSVGRGHIGEILTRYERAGLTIDLLRFSGIMEPPFWIDFYGDLRDKLSPEAYEGHIDYMSSGPVVPMVLVGFDVISRVRAINGPTDPCKALPGTIRGDLGRALPDNAVHSSDSMESFHRENKFWDVFLVGEEKRI